MLLCLLVCLGSLVSAQPRSPEELAELVDEFRSSDPALALEYGNEALAQLADNPSPELRVRIMAEMVWALRRLGRYTEALTLGETARNIAEQYNDRKGLSRTLNNIGIVYWYLGDHEKVLDLWLRALAIREELGDPDGIAGSLNNIGLVYADLGDHDAAIEQFGRALAISEQTGNLEYQANHLDNLGEVYAALNDAAAAEMHYQRGLDVARSEGNQKAEISILINLGSLMLKTEQTDRARRFLETGRQMAEQLGDGTKEAEASLRLAELYLRGGDLDRALAIAEPALDTASDRGDKALLRDVSLLLSDIHAARGEPDLAFEDFRQYTTIAQDMLRQQRDDKITLLQIQFEAANREREIERLTEESVHQEQVLRQAETNRRLMVVALVLALLLILLLVLAYRVKHQSNRVIRRQNEKLEQQRRELTRLARTDPLTGLLNRRALMVEMDAILDGPDPGERQFGLCLLDLDAFKQVNDQHGHEVGDAVLVEVAQRLLESVAPNQPVARWGGEEFMVLMPGASLREAAALADEIRQALERAPVVYRDLIIPTTSSFGVSVHDASARSIRATLRAADHAMYEAKRDGGNCVRRAAAAHPDDVMPAR